MFKKEAPIHVSVHIEKNPHKDEFFCRSHIYLPSAKVLVADEKGKNVSLAVNKAFAALSRQLNKVKYKLEKHLGKTHNSKKLDSLS
jgi:ribosomal subunit interface protein